MKTKILSMVLIAVLAISTTAIAQSEKGRKDNSEKKELMMKKGPKGMKDRADKFFTEEQQEQIKALRLETAKEIKPLKNELNELRAHQQTLTTADKANLKAINSNIDKMAEIKASIEKIMAKQHQAIRSLLTEEQLIKFDSMKGKMGHREGGREGQRDEKGDRPCSE